MMLGLSAFVLVLVKTTILEPFRIFGALPDPFLILVVYASLVLGAGRGFSNGALTGSLMALASPAAWVILPAMYGLAGWLAGLGWRRFMRESFAISFLFLFALGLFVNSCALVAESGLGRAAARASLFEALPGALATALVGPLAYSVYKRYAARWFGGWTGRARERRR